MRMSLVQNRSAELWRSFRPLAQHVEGRVGDDFFSVQIYDNPDYFSAYNPEREFTRWAAIEFGEGAEVASGLQPLILPEGEYAVFDYQGLPSEFGTFAREIYSRILPQAGKKPDDRPHYEIIGPAYRPDDPSAEETICIPVCKI